MIPVDLLTLLAFLPAALALNLTPWADMMFTLGQGLKGGRLAGSAQMSHWLGRITVGIFGLLALRLAVMER